MSDERSAPEVSGQRKSIDVHPAVAAVIGSASAPEASMPPVRPPDSLPGKIGIGTGLRNLRGHMHRGVEQWLALRARYGDIYRTSIMNRSFLAVWNPDDVHRILRNDDRVWSTAIGWDRSMFERLDPRGGNIGALLTLDFDDHRAARALVQPAFTMKAIQGYLAIADRNFADAIAGWLERGEIGFKREVRTLLARVAGEIFTGITDPAKVAVLDRALTDFWHGATALSRNTLISTKRRRSRQGFVTLLQTFRDLVAERRARPGDDLFSHMCQADASELGDDAMVRVFLTIMFGAFDTTSAGVTSMAYLLARHPEWQQRLREEALTIPVGSLDATNLKALKQLEWVWKETMRLYPIASFVPRAPLREIEVMGHKLPAGVGVIVVMGGLGRHPAWWTNPDQFDPDRFAPERAEDKKHPALQMPFGAGAHACVGAQLANVEVKALWHRLLSTCRFSLAQDYQARHTHTPMGCVSGDVAVRLEPLGS